MPTRRQERVNSELVQLVSEALRTLKGPALGLTTVTACEVSPDLHHAKVYVSVFGQPELQEQIMRTLHQNAGQVRFHVGQRLRMRQTPKLQFVLDKSAEKLDRMSRLIREARQSDPHPEVPDESAANEEPREEPGEEN